MIKLIATDIDGTLIRESTGQIYPEILEEIKRLTNQGILFVVASGRQYASVHRMFADVSDRIIYLVENGAHIRYQERDVSLVEMRQDYVEGLIRQLRELKDCEILVSTPKGSLVESKNEEFIDLMVNGYHNDIQIVDDLLAQKEPVIKLAVYHKGSIRKLGENVLIPAWKDKVKACMAGEDWVDFMELSVDKGNALQMIQRQFGVTRAETMAFGDNSNDLGLMLAAGESYAVENARPEIKEAAKYTCPSWKEKGVWQIVRQVEKRTQEEG